MEKHRTPRRFNLDDIPQAYATFRSRADGCVKVLVNVP